MKIWMRPLSVSVTMMLPEVGSTATPPGPPSGETNWPLPVPAEPNY
jgi:hypothetical protein